VIDWGTVSLWIPVAGSAMMVALGLRCIFQAERVVADPRSGASDPVTVRRFGYILSVGGAAIFVLALVRVFAGPLA
jgi:hypothetical protein